jgi:hypothetical protein
MIFVSVRECGRGLRAETSREFPGGSVADCVRSVVAALYPDAELGSLDVSDAGVYRRTIERSLMLARAVVIKVRIQGELWAR